MRSVKVAVMHRDGECGLEESYSEAFKWFSMAAEQEDAWAQSQVAQLYHHGLGVEQDYNKAFALFLKAAEKGEPRAKQYVGEGYDFGRGTVKDIGKAIYWYEQAGAEGDGLAYNNIGCFYQDGDGVEQDYRKAFEYFLKAANMGNPAGQGNLAYCFGIGQGVEENLVKALDWYIKAADAGNAIAQNSAGRYFYFGIDGVRQDYAQAYKYLKMAYDNGEGDAADLLGNCYANGLGTNKNIYLAESMYTQYIQQGNRETEYDLASLYIKWPFEAADFSQKVAQGIEILQRLAYNENYGTAFGHLGTMYETGMHFEVDYNKAVECYQKAVAAGFEPAKEDLTRFKRTLLGGYKKIY